MAQNFFAGVAVAFEKLTEVDRQRLRAAGLNGLRTGTPGFSAEYFLTNRGQPADFFHHRETMAKLREAGFRFIGITPGPKDMPAIAGPAGSARYLDNYRKICMFLGQTYGDLIDYWQVANELDIWIFRDSLTLEQSAEFLKAGIRGLKDANHRSKVGINLTLFPSRPGEVDGNTDRHEGVFLAKSIYEDPDLPVDYAGFDSYPGTWREGGPESWNDYLDAFHALTRKPILIQEFGYSSAGDLMTCEEVTKNNYPCQVKKWKHSWRGAHNPGTQADFISESYRIFAQKPFVIGAVYYRWNDQPTCWQCGQPDCPAETAWGLVDCQNRPKPSYYSIKSSLELYYRQ
ncbi:MAG: hypothetical protein LBH01_07565 [Verrucomicrobiales bacterium]|jgi:hypothetical protein|nr:hypothetical protein [Verrucomicrobiales bacterium]